MLHPEQIMQIPDSRHAKHRQECNLAGKSSAPLGLNLDTPDTPTLQQPASKSVGKVLLVPTWLLAPFWICEQVFVGLMSSSELLNSLEK